MSSPGVFLSLPRFLLFFEENQEFQFGSSKSLGIKEGELGKQLRSGTAGCFVCLLRARTDKNNIYLEPRFLEGR